MSEQMYFHNLAHQVRDLLGCWAACLVLGCPDAELSHPLLDLFPPHAPGPVRSYGSPALAALLQNERVRAFYDVALQTGLVQGIDQCQVDIGGVVVQSIAVAPLERPAGALGIFLLADPLPGSFGRGEQRLLSNYLRTISGDVEKEVRSLCSSLVSSNRAETATDLRQSESLKGEFISMISHELRSPLTAIKGYAGLLQAYSVPDRLEGRGQTAEMTPRRQQQYLDTIMEQTRHLEVLVSDLLDISRLEAGRLALHFTRVDAGPLCQQVVQLAQQRVDQQQPGRYRFRCTVTPELPLAWADPDRVQQILTNLVENAIKYSPDGGLIEVAACAHPAWLSSQERDVKAFANMPALNAVQITVRDQGIGIADGQRSLLFKPFSRLDHPITSQVRGAGLGLYISCKLVEAMGGSIELSSREGEGTSVTVTFPPVRSEEMVPAETDFIALSGQAR